MKLSALNENIKKPLRIVQILANNPDIPVLFISDPANGDTFQFGTREELDGELHELKNRSEIDAMVSTGRELLAQLDFGTYTQEPHIRM